MSQCDLRIRKRRITTKTILPAMSGNDEDLTAFLEGFGFAQDELRVVVDGLNAFRSIAGTTLKRYTNRVIETIDEEVRHAF